MKTNITNTPKQLAKLATVMDALAQNGGAHPYNGKSFDALRNAQRNLEGRTHYVDTNTLSFHKSRVLAANADAEGLLFVLLTSDAADREIWAIVAFLQRITKMTPEEYRTLDRAVPPLREEPIRDTHSDSDEPE